MEATETQHEMPMAEPQKEHHWLKRLVGEWTYESEAPAESGAPPMKATGVERVRSVGDLWFIMEGTGEMPGGGDMTMVMTLGYDPDRQRFVGTWVGSMMTHMWVYSGELDEAERVLTLHTEGPSMTAKGQTAQYREIIEFKTDDHRVFTSEMLGDDGSWVPMMTASSRRRK